MSELNQRFLSLDVFRGLTIGFMIIVNSPGSGAHSFAPLVHAAWNGFTPTDLVFPSFLFAIGSAMSFSLRKYVAEGNLTVLRKVIWRTSVIFLLGYLMYWFPFFRIDAAGNFIEAPFSGTRIPGVLQRLALCYGMGALLVLYIPRRLLTILGVALLLFYWALLLIAGDAEAPLSLTGNAVSKLDLWLFGPGHLWHGEGIPFDPEGMLSTLPALINLLIGYWTGEFIQKNGKNYETVARLMLTAVVLLFAAYCWQPFFPFNKKLWSSSFVLLTSGLDIMIMAVLFYLLELKNSHKACWPGFFVIFGKNPLVIYLISELMLTVFWMVRTPSGKNLYDFLSIEVFQSIVSGPLGSLLFALSVMMFCWLIALLMDHKKIYIRV
ncbi:MAG TPA: DUF5009 domain-containing protein [Bacteroidales bacterium]|nr:MAG: DUF5009 domain-containing protein [Bacteroidetes bacterium GWE2_42_24]OFY29725.1 MAG: DUF5009 domain-containing protein [Bacteroidetes bacterium GWF2_43_11]HAQ65150.1 DUF5009 domain-containing protein [Bacteroidales bacterium]HBZ65845.1 DUF5009 domain-containing protein [Bacteroidales bacterium]